MKDVTFKKVSTVSNTDECNGCFFHLVCDGDRDFYRKMKCTVGGINYIWKRVPQKKERK